MCNKSQSKHLLHFYFSNNITTMFVSFLSKWWNMLWHPKQLHVSMCCRVYWRQMSNWWVARKQNDKETLTLTLGQTWIKSGTTVTPLPCYQHLVALFPETHISFFVILRKTTLQVVPPVFLKLHTGLWKCALCELYTLKNHVCSTYGMSLESRFQPYQILKINKTWLMGAGLRK